ncbi:Hypothetical predicted protein [Pelobates cultripes]|uniref:Uncharacterized protein n=1 Tax=Pelobates cultripes TaxID=61616 RepID=A0AAD1TES0_PELCU|nr:Hypothetical predicted protein [Pelobates cultripes]
MASIILRNRHAPTSHLPHWKRSWTSMPSIFGPPTIARSKPHPPASSPDSHWNTSITCSGSSNVTYAAPD